MNASMKLTFTIGVWFAVNSLCPVFGQSTDQYAELEFDSRIVNVSDLIKLEPMLEKRDTLDFSFQFKNTSTHVLKIESIETSCTCTVAAYPEIVKSGRSDVIVLRTTWPQIKLNKELYAIVRANVRSKYVKVRIRYDLGENER